MISSDQCTTSRKNHHRSRRWYLSGVFLQVLDWCAHNSFVLWSDFNPASTFSNKSVKRCLADNLMTFALNLDGSTASTEPTGTEEDTGIQLPFDKTVCPPPLDHRLVSRWRLDRSQGHYPGVCHARKDCVGHRQRKRVSTYCTRCHVFLCLDSGCFIRFHEEEDYLYDDPLLSGPNRRVREQFNLPCITE